MRSISNGFLHQLQPSRTCVCPILSKLYPAIPAANLLNPLRQYSRPSSSPPLNRRLSTNWTRNAVSARSKKDSRIINSRSYVSASGHPPKQSEEALMEELRRLSHGQESGQPMLGPFMMPRGKAHEKPLRDDEYHHWSRVSWSERIRRMFRMGRNLLIVSFGGSLGILVIYSITSELFAPSSTTNLMNMTIRTIEESDQLSKILKSPIKFHTSPTPSGNSISKRSNGIPQSVQHQSGVVELRFWVESCKPSLFEGDWKSLDWWRSWIGPLITSEIYHHPTNRSSDSISNSIDSQLSGSDSNSTRWWPGLLKSLMPNTLGRSSSSANEQKSWTARFFSNHGSFEHGEVVAQLIKDSNGQWKYKSLVIDFPDSQNVKYRLNIANELKRKELSKLQTSQADGDEDDSKQPTRYRFWNRRINL
ncbi:hypothetical protein PTTG_03729 [Puccinia triticina 1-1 BBBD Race 1]|uniref:Mitochondrial import inner membrane translocase subunit TIM21 n=1 Tax=Puccinia triticina (isolate 1-1 / race 1 (BBBD)) TaxID=630390 RepID=A0A180GGC9_PUCT1|nr:hypothetical protein PTTG_03729 [Puccinia triticina 1-1 BBBD Race 1]